ncbi:sensor histidine kinase [Tissierella praeacuta]|uniref:Two-component system, sensor histidine kinase YesM n=2 Tax=Tissierella praeacuta TaxID=43131 RepID=A0A1M4V9Z7_9FIRM|nr:sensor histidine kinase [Tissierella praeacuta]MBU5257539.1 sensor histidine kinase [Tissierella praeacuta]SHE65697.1 two-component system, sensor histidine kinase YesM [Tissierella praeacuta DSM 18095]SUP03074.1 Probable sensor-like histidine kinase YehU [Tissierella praeacuta]
MSLRLKIILVFVLCIILTFSPLLFILETKVKTLNMEQLEHQTLQLIDSKSIEIGSWLNQRISEIRIIHEYVSTNEFNLMASRLYLTRLNKVLSKQYGNLNETFAIGALDGYGWINDNITIHVSNRDYFNKVMSSDVEYVISKPLVSKSDNTPIFIICYPIINDKNKKIGFINGAVNLEKISEIASSIDVYNGFSWIMNKDMDIYSISKDILTNKYISTEELNKIVKKSKEINSGRISLKNIYNKDATLFFSSIPYTEDWILCTIIENNYIHAQTNNIINLVIILGIILLFFSILLAIIISGTLVKPIYKLKNHMVEVSNGNLDSYYETKNNDEISILGKVFNQMLMDIKKLINQVYKVQTQKRNAELRVLQSQINPHFLYNTLDTIQWKALEYKAFDVADMINSLSIFFRISLSDGKEFITISDEIEHVRNYLEIQKTRYKDKISYSINLKESISQNLVPKMIIQPLVENSIYHGLKLKKQKGIININVLSENDYIIIEVIDNGIGMNHKMLATTKDNLYNSIESEHYGLYNINERLKLTFKDKYNIDIDSEFGKGTKVLLKIPKISEGFQCLE